MSGAAALEALRQRLAELSPEDRGQLAERYVKRAEVERWIPNPGPQTEAYYCEADELFYGGSAGSGKRLCNQTPVPVPLWVDPTGFKPHGNLQVGDHLYSPSGHTVQVADVLPVVHETDAYEVHFDTGEVICADGDHLWLTWSELERKRLLRSTEQWRANRRSKRLSRAVAVSKKPWVSANVTQMNRDRKWSITAAAGSVRTTREIALTLKVGPKWNHTVALTEPLLEHDADLPIDPYIFGLWIGDGYSKAPSIGMCSTDWEALDRVSPLPKCDRVDLDNRPPRKQQFETRSWHELRPKLKSLGVWGDKRIPSLYLRASKAQRLAVLQGIMDTDGHCATDGHMECGFSKEDLAKDLLELICSLGLKGRIRRKKARCQNGNGEDHFRTCITSSLPLFRLPRKLERQKLEGYCSSVKHRSIVAVRKVPSVPMRCIRVANQDGLYLVGRSFITTHNTDLAVGLAYNEHSRALILREFNEDARSMGERLLEITDNREGWNGTLLRYKEDDQLIEFAGLPAEKDKQRHKGIPKDLIVWDELGDFYESQYLFVNAWCRSTKPGQRCRILCTGNPPTRSKGLWVIRRWAAWLDPKHPNPARSGEIRWYISDEDGMDTEVDGPGPHLVDGKEVTARSRCFIRGTLDDNPDLAANGTYQATLDALPKEMRDAYRDGKFDAALNDAPNQVIPTAWVLAAQQRWKPTPPEGVPMCAIGADIAQGGKDNVVLSPRYDGWYAQLETKPGKDVTDGPAAAAFVIQIRRHNAVVVVDMGGGFGGDCYTHLKYNIGSEYLVPWKGAEKSNRKAKDKVTGFVNKRSAACWMFREALDPTQEGGSPIALPPDPELTADLTSLTWEPTPHGIKVISKESVCALLGRSTDKGDSVIMSWQGGPTYVTHGRLWRSDPSRVRGSSTATPSVNMGKRREARR